MAVGRWPAVAGNPAGERPPTNDQRRRTDNRTYCRYLSHILTTRTLIDQLAGSLESPPDSEVRIGRIGMCRRSDPLPVTTRNVFRAFPFQLILAASVAWGQDASTGALRGVVLDDQRAAITTADIVAIRGE